MRCAKCGKKSDRVTGDQTCCFACHYSLSTHAAHLVGVIVLKTMSGHPADDILDVVDALAEHWLRNRAYLDIELANTLEWFLSQFADETTPGTLEL